MNICRRQALGQRAPLPIDDEMVFRAQFAAVRRVRAGARPPFTARTLPESNETRLQSISPRMPSSSSNTCCNRPNTPARCHAWSRLQQVTPLQPNTSSGRSRHAIPVLSTKRIPRRQSRSDRLGRPRFVLRRETGSKGSTRFHNSSGTSSRLIPHLGTSHAFVYLSSRFLKRALKSVPGYSRSSQ
jgi:hypothetical protein